MGKIEAQFLKDIGYQLKPGVSENASIRLIPEPQGDMYPSLGVSMDALLRQLQEIAYIVSDDLRVVNWYYANLEYSSATCLDNLSLTNWMHGNCEKTYEESDASESEDESKADHHADIHSASPTNSRKQVNHNSSDFTGAPSIIKMVTSTLLAVCIFTLKSSMSDSSPTLKLLSIPNPEIPTPNHPLLLLFLECLSMAMKVVLSKLSWKVARRLKRIRLLLLRLLVS